MSVLQPPVQVPVHHQIRIKLVQCSSPPEIFFLCSFPKASPFFPGCSQVIANFQPPEMEHTVLNLTTDNGRLSTPPVHQSTQERLVVLKQFSLNILKENLSFSTPPFDIWRQVECQQGFLSFPPNQSLLAPLPDHQQPMAEFYHRQPNNPGRARQVTSFNVPPPPLPLPYGHRGSWTTQNASWDNVPYNPTDPNLMNLPFERQQPKSHSPHPRDHAPSRLQFLESFRKTQRKMKEAEQRYLQENLENIALSRTSSAHGSTSPNLDLLESADNQPDQINTSGTNNQVSTSTTNAQIHVVDKTNQPAENFQTPTLARREDLISDINNSRPRRRLNPDGVDQIQSMSIDHQRDSPPLASSQQYSTDNPRPLSKTVQQVPAQNDALVTQPVDVISTPAPVSAVGGHNQTVLSYTPAGAAALVTSTQSSVRPKVSSTEDRIIQTRKQAKQHADRSEQETNALGCLLTEAIENHKIKAIFKIGDKMPDFLVTYASKILSRANAHPPPDELADCLSPYLYCADDVYALSQSNLNHEILNILNALYEFENSSESTPSKLSSWLKQKYKGRSKSALD